jgi:hypothetical protein
MRIAGGLLRCLLLATPVLGARGLDAFGAAQDATLAALRLAAASRLQQAPSGPAVLFLPHAIRGAAPRQEPSRTPPPQPSSTRPASWPTPTPPRATWTPRPLPTGTPDGWALRPPSARLIVPGVGQQVSSVGTYCWRPAGVCRDLFCTPTLGEPLRLRSPFVGRLELVPSEAPTVYRLEVVRADELEAESGPGGQRCWRWSGSGTRAAHYDLLPLREQDLQLAREPGLYVLSLFVVWEELGDASYGFLIEVLP